MLYMYSLCATVIALSLDLVVAIPELNDINILVVTDAHSWISKHIHDDHDPVLNADYGSIASAYLNLKSLASETGKDVFLLNNGDHVEGSGLSDASVYTNGIHGYDLFPLIGMMPFDALNIGNHDLYDNSTVEYMTGASNFVEGWNGNYLTSNVYNATTNDNIGSTHTILKGENSDTSILVFGFLYHQTDACAAVNVEDPSDTVLSPWFLSALQEGVDAGVSAIVVLSHMDLKDDNVYVLQEAIRGYGDTIPELQNMPLQFLTGHTHYRGWSKLDDFSSTFEAGHYLDTLGWISFSADTSSPTWFDFQYVDANLDELYNFTGTDASTFDTDLGLEISSAIEATVEELGLRTILGCPQQDYSYAAGLGTEDSLYDLYMQKVIPLSVLNIPTGTGNTPWHLSSTGSLRYDIYSGEFYYDDVFAIAPFVNVFRYVADLSGQDLQQIVNELSQTSNDSPVRTLLPKYVGGPDSIDPNLFYDLFFNDYDEPYIVDAVEAVVGEDVVVVNWRDDSTDPNFVDTTLCWATSVPALFPCDTDDV
ncbi:hypothetical protein TrVE_jg12982 [Triparma verrucosa]|uniref:Putative 5'-nucleotidase C-terminal domain-containing protein n=1 Tax=Triparma verrucosa TaxID=1606542 RepID=A0A9W7EID9_9STRA|nr:hypothetical protein TrVE_jg12982 [Triparma verrucosa]